ncbi:MAG TPA: S41 family peptidase [Anaerolineae bacterium]
MIALRRVSMLTLIVIALLAGGLGGAVLDRQVFAAPSAQSAANTLNVNLINEAWNIIHRSYVEPSVAQPNLLTYGAISGMVDALGDTGHSTFMTPAQRQQEHNYTQGHFEGIGAEVQSKDHHVVIVAPMDGSPAQRAGLKPGDIILKVNGTDVSDLPLDQVTAKIIGPAGTDVTLTIQSADGSAPRDVTLTRARIEVKSVTSQYLPGTRLVHIRVAAFSDGATRELQAALTDAQSHDAAGIILDLRNDPGGLLSEAIGVASEFLRTGNVLQEKNAQGKITDVPARPTGTTTNLPVVVLINNGTASASEIVAGALQDAKRATLVGETTFGTGTVLNEFDLSDGSAMLLATEEWLTPNGRVIWHHGIAPDEQITLSAQVTPLTPESEQGLSAAQVQNTADEQVLRAIQLLDHQSTVQGTVRHEEKAY